MNLTKPITLIYLLASSLIILCSSAQAQESPSASLVRTPPAGAPRRPKIPDKCETPSPSARNWELIGHGYVFFDYVLCPPGLQPPAPLVSVWLSAKGDGFSIEKWAEGRDGADLVSVYRGNKMAFTLYRDLDAVPLSLFKAERRSAVPAEMARQPFLREGSHLIPLTNLAPESVERVKKVFGSTDVLIKQAQRKSVLLNESPKIGIIVDALEKPLKQQ